MSERESRPGESGPFVSTVQPSDEELVDGLARRRMEGWTTRPLTRTGGPLDAVPVAGGTCGGLYGTLLSEDIIPTGGGPRVDKIHGVLTDDPRLVEAVSCAINGDDEAAVMGMVEQFGLSAVEAGELLAAVLGEGVRPFGCYLDSAGRMRLTWGKTSGPEPIRSTPSLTGLTLTMPSATHPSGVRSLSLEEIDEVFSALDEERRQTGEDLEDRAETLAWMRREVARLDTFESTFLAVNELCPPSDWLRDLKAASHDPDALADLLRRATAARAEKDMAGAEAATVADRHNCRTCAHGGRFACNLYGSMRSEALAWRASNTTGDGCPGWEGKATGEGFQTPSAPAQPSPVMFCGDGTALDLDVKPPTVEPAQPTPLPIMLTAAQSFILADTCLDATPYEKGAHDAAMAILRGDLSKGDPRVTLRGQVEDARQTAHALESTLVQVKAERDRALAVLAAETGKQGLPGWTWDERDQDWSIHYRERAVRLTAWGVQIQGGPGFHARVGIKTLSTGTATDALDAMEKATAWARVRGYTGEAPDLEAIVPVQARTEIAHLWDHGVYSAAVEIYRSCFLEPMTYNEACNALDLYFESKSKEEPTTHGPV